MLLLCAPPSPLYSSILHLTYTKYINYYSKLSVAVSTWSYYILVPMLLLKTILKVNITDLRSKLALKALLEEVSENHSQYKSKNLLTTWFFSSTSNPPNLES